MKLEPGDLVEIVAVPPRIDRGPASGDRVPAPGDRLGEPERQVYRSCLGFKLAIVRVDDDGLCVFQLHEEWSHFPGIAPFDLRFDADCLRKIEPFADAEWATLSNWMDSDAPISGEVIAVEGKLKVRLDGAMLGDLALPDEASPSDYLGKTIPVQIIMLNRKKRELVVYPVSPLRVEPGARMQASTLREEIVRGVPIPTQRVVQLAHLSWVALRSHTYGGSPPPG